MRFRKLPTELKFRVHEYYYQRYHGKLFDEDVILSELSQALKEVDWHRLVVATYMAILKTCPLITVLFHYRIL